MKNPFRQVIINLILKLLRKLFHDNFLKYMSPLNFSKLGQGRVSCWGERGGHTGPNFKILTSKSHRGVEKDSRTTEQLYLSGPMSWHTFSTRFLVIVPLWLDYLGTFPATPDQLTSVSTTGSLPSIPSLGHSSPVEIEISSLPVLSLSSNTGFYSPRLSQGTPPKMNPSPNSLWSITLIFSHITYHYSISYLKVCIYLSRNEVHRNRNFWSVLLPAPNSVVRSQYFSNKLMHKWQKEWMEAHSTFSLLSLKILKCTEKAKYGKGSKPFLR